MISSNRTENQRLTMICQKGVKSFYLYKPTPFRLLYHHFEKMTLSRRVRLLLEYFAKGRYCVSYLAVNGTLVGHCVIASGNRRLKRSSEQDIVLGPYFVDPSFRGHGYAKDLIEFSLHHAGLHYRYAYDYIKKDNHSSRKASQSCGFELCGELDIEGVFHKLVERPGGAYDIFQYIPQICPDGPDR